MLDEKDLQAIAAMLAQQKQDILGEVSGLMVQQKQDILGEVSGLMVQQKQDILGEVSGLMVQQKQDILSEVKGLMGEEIAASERRMQILMEGFFTPRFNLLAENQQIIREQMVTKEDLTVRLEDIQAEILLLRTAVKRNAQEIEKLKKAQ